MKYKFQKTVRLLGDMITYCHSHGADEFQMHVKMGNEWTVFEISCPIDHFDEAELKHLQDRFDIPRQHEVEQNYWGLSGEPETDAGLVLMGMMIDKAEVWYENGHLHIHAHRKEK